MSLFLRSILFLFQTTVCALAVSGCGILSSSIVSDNNKLDKDIELAKKSQELAAELKDFQVLKPSLTRLVALESDLSFLLDEVSRFSESNPVIYNASSRTPASELSKVPSGNSVVYKSDGSMMSSADEPHSDSSNFRELETRNFETDLLRLQQGSTSTNAGTNSLRGVGFSTSSNQDVVVAPARPILSADKSSISKFQGMQGPDAIVGGIDNVTSSKFSSQPSANNLLPRADGCSSQPTSDSSNFALHLASYKNFNNAKSGWLNLRQKYASTWCEASARLETVSVKGTDYFSLRVGGYDSKEAANQMCSKIRAQGDYCQVASFSGVSI